MIQLKFVVLVTAIHFSMLLFVGLPLITIPQGTTVDINLVYTCGPFRTSSQMLFHDLCSQVSILGMEISFIIDFVLFFFHLDHHLGVLH